MPGAPLIPLHADSAAIQPRSILLIKAHSAGVGDLLRSSAAWRALRNRFPYAELHLWFLTRDPGAASEQLIARHHLLASFQVSDKRTQGIAGWKRLLREASAVASRTRPDLIVDFEPNGFRTSLLARILGRQTGAKSIGIAEVPFRAWCYNLAAPSAGTYARSHGMAVPLEYAERDFVALAALGIARGGTPIELQETEEGRGFRARLLEQPGIKGAQRLVGLNIGCGTAGAEGKRPPLDLLAQLVTELQRRHAFALVLTGAPFEQEINRHFLARFRGACPVLDLSGHTSILELAGAIKACSLFISSDSGPYHMAVALRVPTLALFRSTSSEHYHSHGWVQCLVARDIQSLPAVLKAAEGLFCEAG